MDEPGYFTEGNFMTYDNGVRDFIAETAAGFKGGRLALFHRHLLGAAYQLAAFQHAAAVARCRLRAPYGFPSLACLVAAPSTFACSCRAAVSLLVCNLHVKVYVYICCICISGGL